MTQPDLVSKLREVIAKVKPLLRKATAMPWRTNPNNSLKAQKIWGAKGDVIVKEIHSSNALVIVAAVNAMDELQSLLGREGQAAPSSVEELSLGTATCDICDRDTPHYHDPELVEIERYVRPAFEKTCVPRAAFARIGKHFPYSDGGTEQLWQHFISGWFAHKAMMQPAIATPIVPGTAGLSAFEHSEIVRLSSYPNNGVTVAEYVETLLGAAKPAEPGVPLIHGRVELDVHDARIRKDALEEAAKVADQYPTYRREDQSKGSAVADAIRALAERPAPAGEVPVSKPVKMQVRYCGHEVPVGEICPECYPHAAGEVKGEK